MKSNEAKRDEQPLLYYQLHDESNKNGMFRNFKYVMIVFVLLAIGFGVGCVMQNSPTEISTEEMVGTPDMPSAPQFATPREFVVGDEESQEQGCAECVKLACKITLEQCMKNGGGVFVKLLGAHPECNQCSMNMASAEKVVCNELVMEKVADDCKDVIGEVSADECSQPREEIVKMVDDMNNEDHVCSSYPGSVGYELEKQCGEQGVKMSVMPREGEEKESKVGSTERLTETDVGWFPPHFTSDVISWQKTWDKTWKTVFRCSMDSGLTHINYGDKRMVPYQSIWDAGFHLFHWEPAGHVTFLTKAGSAQACAKLCADAQSRAQQSCYWKICSGECWVASHGKRTGTGSIVNFVNNRGGRSNKISVKNYYGGGYRYFKEYGNKGTTDKGCAREGGFCPCQGVVTYVRYDKCKFFGAGCDHLHWDDILKGNYGMVHHKVRGGIHCSNGEAGDGRDPDQGKSKQCFCHPASHAGTQYGDPPASEWTKEHCKQRFAKGSGVAGFFRGLLTGFTCTGLCPAEAFTAAGKGGTVSVGMCSMSCYCLAKGWI